MDGALLKNCDVIIFACNIFYYYFVHLPQIISPDFKLFLYGIIWPVERLLKSKFKIGNKIGENPFSLTYLGTTLSGEQTVIIKIYKRGTLNSVLIKSMKQKVKALTEINYPGIARLYDGDYGWQGFYYVREYVDGLSLKEYLKSHRPDVDEAIDLLNKIAAPLSYAHRKGIIHGALKPSNVFLDKQMKAILVDFIIEGEVKESMPQKAVFILEASDYASPEEIYGNPAGKSSDIYSLGIMLYEILTGNIPFKGDPQKKLSGLAPKVPSLPNYLEDILFKALSRDPLLRFKSVDEIIESSKCRTLVEFKENWDLPPVELENTLRAEEKAVLPVRQERKRSFFILIILLLTVLAGIIYSLINTMIMRQ